MDCGALRDAFRPFVRGEVLYRRGAAPEQVLRLQKGWAIRYQDLAYNRRQILSVLLPGDLVGLLPQRLGDPHDAVQAITDGGYCELSRPKLIALVAEDKAMAERLCELLAREARIADERLAFLARPAPERLARFILDLYYRLRQRGQVTDEGFEFPLRQQDIGDALGLTAIHVGRVMRELRGAGLISVAPGRLRIEDRAGLMTAAGPNAETLEAIAAA